MGLPTQPVTIAPEQLAELNGKLSAMRHDINNWLTLVVAAVDLIRTKPQTQERMLATLVDQPPKITAALAQFSGDFERILGITR